MVKLDFETTHVLGVLEASLASNQDMTTHLGFVFFLTDDSGKLIAIHFNSYKARRVTRSVMGAELISSSYLFDHAFTLPE